VRRSPDRFRFTLRSIERISTPKAKRALYYDSITRGLGINVQPSGHRSFFWFRKVQGTPTWKTLGSFPELGLDAARARAEVLNGQILRWKSEDYEGPFPLNRSRQGLTLNDLLEDYVSKRLRARARRPDRAVEAARSLFKHISQWSDRRLTMISKQDIRLLHAKIGSTHKTRANRVVQFLRTLFNWALREELWKGENPARMISLYPESRRERFLLPAEAPLFFRALAREPNVDLRHFVVLSLFTGARRSDVLSMRWEHIDVKHGVWRVPMPKSGVPYNVPLVDEAIEILRDRERLYGGEWVFPSTGKTGHLTNVKRSWRTLLKRSKLKGLRIHDLRRTLGSWQAGAGVSLPIIGKTLGHQSGVATEIYARLHLDPVREAVRIATQSMLASGKVSTRKLLRSPAQRS
jgi:integrase